MLHRVFEPHNIAREIYQIITSPPEVERSVA